MDLAHKSRQRHRHGNDPRIDASPPGAQLAAGIFSSIEEAQKMMSPGHRVFAPDAEEAEVYEQMYRLYRSVYFSFGAEQVDAQALVHVLPELRRIAAQTRRKTSANERVPDDSVAATGETE